MILLWTAAYTIIKKIKILNSIKFQFQKPPHKISCDDHIIPKKNVNEV